MIQGINHIGISTGDLDRSLAFYRDLIGMEVLGSAKFEGEVFTNGKDGENPLEVWHEQVRFYDLYDQEDNR